MAAVALLTSVVPAGRASADRGFEYSGSGCSEAVVIVPVLASRAREAVPRDKGYVVLTEGAGVGQLGVATLRCATMSVAGVRADGTTLSDVGILVGRGEEVGWYQLWQHGDSRPLHERLRGLGVAGELAGPSFALDTGSPVHHFDARWPLADGGYSISGSATAPAGEDDEAAAVWWHEGPHGRVRITYDIEDAAVGGGAGLLSAAGGSALARVVGAETVIAPAALIGMAFRAEARLDVSDEAAGRGGARQPVGRSMSSMR